MTVPLIASATTPGGDGEVTQQAVVVVRGGSGGDILVTAQALLVLRARVPQDLTWAAITQ